MYYSTYCQVDLDAIVHNIIEMKQYIRPETKLLVVVKADAYGHGALPVAKAVDPYADYYAVAHLSEAKELRRGGIHKPILILGYCHPMEFQEMINLDITLNIFSLKEAMQLSQMACECGRKAKVHIKIDTGMHRIGYLCNEESVKEIKGIADLPGIELEGIFTHFAKADEEDKTSFQQQVDEFKAMLYTLEQEGIHFALRHGANSATISEVGDLGLDMVRCGISTYGLYASEEINHEKVDLHPAMVLKSCVTHVKTLPQGAGIGYGWTYKTKGETQVATIPVGYADGYKRALSNKACVLLHGQRAPIIGRVCMDQFMVDVTHIPQVEPGDEVVLIGSQGEERISVEELAAMSESFNYEFVCGINRRVPRQYMQNGEEHMVVDYLEHHL